MPVVPAGMHGFRMGGTKAFGRGTVSLSFFLFHIVAVHVKTEGNRLAGSAGIQNAYHTGFAAGHLFHQHRVRAFCDGTFHIPFQFLSGRTPHHGGFRYHFSAKMHFVAQCFQFTDYQGSRAELRPTGFRMGMEITPPGNQFRF